MEYTPGPWAVNPILSDPTLWAVIVPGYCVIAEVPQEQWHESETEANARLIAAAPELLAACLAALDDIKIALSWTRTIEPGPNDIEALRQHRESCANTACHLEKAINKATDDSHKTE